MVLYKMDWIFINGVKRMDENKKKVIESFDAISQIDNRLWNHNNHYYKRAMEMIKTADASILDIGCGDGDFLSLGAHRGYKCTGVDFSSGMIDKAKRTPDAKNCDFICGDIYDVLPEFPEESFDAAFSFATMHHLDYEKLLPALKRVMKKTGFFCVVDILESSTPIDYFYNACAIIPNIIRKRIICRNAWQSEEARRLWDEHGKLDTYMKYGDIQAIMDKLGYDYKLKRLLYFRYMLLVDFSGDGMRA